MIIDLNLIDANPHRDLARNPLEPEQVSHVSASIERTGYWENVVVRENPDAPGRYELAYGHNRLEALRRLGADFAEFIVKPLSDYDMLTAMIDENATQRNQTVRIVFENIVAAIKLAERLLNATKNVKEFHDLARPTRCPSQDNVPSEHTWRENEYAKAKHCLETGKGLGRGFLQHFLPDGIRYANDTIQNALDSYYAESRKAVAEREAQEAEAEIARMKREIEEAEQRAAKADTNTATGRREASRAANVAKQKRAQADKATATATKARKEADRLDSAGFDRDLLERLPSASHMQEIVQLAKVEKIPSEYHERLINVCLNEGWTTGGGRSPQISHTILNAGRVWWYKVSGHAERDRKEAHKQNLKWKHRSKSIDEFTRDTIEDIKDLMKALDAITPFCDQIENSTLLASYDTRMKELEERLHKAREAIPRPENVTPLDLKRLGS